MAARRKRSLPGSAPPTRTSTSSASAGSRTYGTYSTVMASPDELLDQFVSEWNAGKRPRAEEYLERAPAEERDALAGLLNAFLDQAPPPRFAPETWAAIQREPAVSELGALAESR